MEQQRLYCLYQSFLWRLLTCTTPRPTQRAWRRRRSLGNPPRKPWRRAGSSDGRLVNAIGELFTSESGVGKESHGSPRRAADGRGTEPPAVRWACGRSSDGGALKVGRFADSAFSELPPLRRRAISSPAALQWHGVTPPALHPPPQGRASLVCCTRGPPRIDQPAGRLRRQARADRRLPNQPQWRRSAQSHPLTGTRKKTR